MSIQVLQWSLLLTGAALIIIIQLGFRLVRYYINQNATLAIELKQTVEKYEIQLQDERSRYERLAENKDSTIMEEKLSIIERNMRSTIHLYEQEIQSSFSIMKNTLDIASGDFDQYHTALEQLMDRYNVLYETLHTVRTEPERSFEEIEGMVS